MFKLFAGLMALLSLMASPVLAEELGPEIGSQIPHDLTLPDASGADRSFVDLTGEKGMALFFVRSLDWCPFCKAQARDASTRYAEFEERGLSVVVVSYDEPSKLQSFVSENGFLPAALSDKKIEAINAFGLRNEKHKEGSRFYGIPHPAVFIVDTEKTVRAKFYEEDFATNARSYANRPAIDVILEGADQAFAQ